MPLSDAPMGSCIKALKPKPLGGCIRCKCGLGSPPGGDPGDGGGPGGGIGCCTVALELICGDHVYVWYFYACFVAGFDGARLQSGSLVYRGLPSGAPFDTYSGGHGYPGLWIAVPTCVVMSQAGYEELTAACRALLPVGYRAYIEGACG